MPDKQTPVACKDVVISKICMWAYDMFYMALGINLTEVVKNKERITMKKWHRKSA